MPWTDAQRGGAGPGQEIGRITIAASAHSCCDHDRARRCWRGAYLAMLGGSAYYLVGGIAVALAGWWSWRGEARDGWAYGLFLAATIIWALRESGQPCRPAAEAKLCALDPQFMGSDERRRTTRPRPPALRQCRARSLWCAALGAEREVRRLLRRDQCGDRAVALVVRDRASRSVGL